MGPYLNAGSTPTPTHVHVSGERGVGKLSTWGPPGGWGERKWAGTPGWSTEWSGLETGDLSSPVAHQGVTLGLESGERRPLTEGARTCSACLSPHRDVQDQTGGP